MTSAPAVSIRPARPDEAALLSGIAFRSKAYWGYPNEFMEACRDELTLTGEYIGAGRTTVAEVDGRVAGFSALQPLGDGRVELDYLFVEPGYIGTGIGRALMERAVASARALGFATMVIQADPNAEPFYQAAGAVTVSTRPSGSIAGRDLPLMELTLG